jgi:hypothetical protein
MTRRVLAKFRVDYSHASNKAPFDMLIAELSAQSPIFRELWNGHEVVTRSVGVGRYPQLGGIAFEHSSYIPEGYADLRVVTYVPHDENSAAKVAAWRDLQSREPKARNESGASGQTTSRPSTRSPRKR